MRLTAAAQDPSEPTQSGRMEPCHSRPSADLCESTRGAALCVCRRQSRQPLSLQHSQSCAHSTPGLSCPIPVPGMVPHQQTKPWAGGGWQCFFSGPRTLQPSTGSWCLCARQVARPASPAHAAATQLPTAPAVSLSPAVLWPAKVQGPGWAAGESLALIAAPHK